MPIVYYRVRRILQRIDEPGAGTYVENPELRGESLVDLAKVGGIELDFFFYYSKDFGGGTHVHDVESVETRLAVARRPGCQECPWVIGLMRVDRQGPRHPVVRQHARRGRRDEPSRARPGRGRQARVLHRPQRRRPLHAGLRRDRARQRRLGRARHAGDRHVLHGPVPVVDDEGAAGGARVCFPRCPRTARCAKPTAGTARTLRTTPCTSFGPIRRPEPAAPDLKPYIADKGDPNWPEVVADTDLKRFETWLGTSPSPSRGRSRFVRTGISACRWPSRS